MPFTNSAVLIQDDSGATHAFLTSQSSPLNINIPSGSTGIWSWVVSREGYSSQIGQFDSTGGGFDFGNASPLLRTQVDGSMLYMNTSSSLITINFDLTSGSETCFIDVGEGSVTAQEIVDMLEVALTTEDGCKFLSAREGSESSLAILAGQTFLLLNSGYRIRRRSSSDINATVSAFVVPRDGVSLDGVNGGVQFLEGSSGITDSDIQRIWSVAFSQFTAPNTSGGVLNEIRSLSREINNKTEL